MSGWSLSVVEEMAAIFATAAIAFGVVLAKDNLFARVGRSDDRVFGTFIAAALILLGLLSINVIFRDRLTLSISDHVDPNQIITGHLFGAKGSRVFVVLGSLEGSGYFKYETTRPDCEGKWTATVHFGGTTNTRFTVRALGLDAYASGIIGDSALVSVEHLDDIATYRSRTFEVIEN